MFELALIVLYFSGYCTSLAEPRIHNKPEDNAKLVKYLKYLIPKISYCLVKKSWKIEGHSDEEIHDQYLGTWEEAFKIMYREYYPYLKRKLQDSEELFTVTNERGEVEYDPRLESIIIFHPLNGKANSPFVRAAMTGLRLRNLHKRYNLIAVDMGKLNLNLYLQLYREITGFKAKYHVIAEALGHFIVRGIENHHWAPHQIHLVGFSVSASIVGYIGRYIFTIYNEKLRSILSLDPYSNPKNQYYIHISRDDAEVVHVYHSCSHVSGSRERIGTADFVFNGGYIQPECKNKLEHIEPFSCSHKKIALRFWYIILFPRTFKARRCGTWQRFKHCFCELNDDVTITYPIGDNPARGIYHIRTSGTKPYGLGEEGSRCKPEKKLIFLETKAALLRRAKVKQYDIDANNGKKNPEFTEAHGTEESVMIRTSQAFLVAFCDTQGYFGHTLPRSCTVMYIITAMLLLFK